MKIMIIPAKHQIITYTVLSEIAASPNIKRHNQSLQLGQMRGQTGAGLRVSDEQGPPAVGHHHQSAGKKSLGGNHKIFVIVNVTNISSVRYSRFDFSVCDFRLS